MIENTMFIIFGILMYWGVCRLFTTYDRKCLSKDLFIKTKNKSFWLLIAGRYRGRRRMPEEDWYKISIVGLVTYISLLPVLLFFCFLVLDITFEDMPQGSFWTTYTFIVIFLNIMDEILGNIFSNNK